MTTDARERARRVQDLIIKDKRTAKYVEEMGEDYPLFGEGTPTYSQIKSFVYPQYLDRMERFISTR